MLCNDLFDVQTRKLFLAAHLRIFSDTSIPATCPVYEHLYFHITIYNVVNSSITLCTILSSLICVIIVYSICRISENTALCLTYYDTYLVILLNHMCALFVMLNFIAGCVLTII